ncbi:MAG: putative cytosolic protein [Dehalococcoidia bacterium]|nr:putative cytosolic protein [Dehalococcoidia bacterium]
MARILKDEEIEELITEEKVLPPNWQNRLRPRPKTNYAYSERELPIRSVLNRAFHIVIRTNRINLLDFSIILMFEDDDQMDYRLMRCNGFHSSKHTNKWEKERSLPNSWFNPTFHIHRATERYQIAGYAIDGYAEPCDEYSSYEAALTVFLSRCRLNEPPSPQGQLF